MHVDDLPVQTRDQLRDLAKDFNIRGRGAMSKAKLIAALTEEITQRAAVEAEVCRDAVVDVPITEVPDGLPRVLLSRTLEITPEEIAELGKYPKVSQSAGEPAGCNAGAPITEPLPTVEVLPAADERVLIGSIGDTRYAERAEAVAEWINCNHAAEAAGPATMSELMALAADAGMAPSPERIAQVRGARRAQDLNKPVRSTGGPTLAAYKKQRDAKRKAAKAAKRRNRR